MENIMLHSILKALFITFLLIGGAFMCFSAFVFTDILLALVFTFGILMVFTGGYVFGTTVRLRVRVETPRYR